MNDRELLELAAKAAGISPATFDRRDVGWYQPDKGTTGPWDPLTDDGDALRLAVKLWITAFPNPDHLRMEAHAKYKGSRVFSHVNSIGGRPEDMRLAITMVAAQIGGMMP